MEGNYFNSNILALANSNSNLAIVLKKNSISEGDYPFIEAKSGDLVRNNFV